MCRSDPYKSGHALFALVKESRRYSIIILFILHFGSLNLGVHLQHVNDGTDAVSLLHRLEGVVDLTKHLAVSDELVDLERAVLVVGDEAVHLRATLDTTESASPPHTTSDKLECCEMG